jgi:4-diphosphocytidyl-2-C-methyl-D-erythritol kinase
VSAVQATDAREAAPAKVNLALHVRRRREDGYHDIESIFAFTDAGDRLSCTIQPADQVCFGLEITGPFAEELTAAPSNLVLTAARALHAHAGARVAPGRYLLHLDKRLPVASGIGGGSADAAAALRLLNRSWGLSLSLDELTAVGAGIGSDVPACVHSRTLFASGRGELLRPLAPVVPPRWLLLVNPGIAVETGPVFAGWDGHDRGPLTVADGDDPPEVARYARNDLQPGACRRHPIIAEALDLLASLPGARLARMSGSGATCFALFDKSPACSDAAAAVRRLKPCWWVCGTHMLP